MELRVDELAARAGLSVDTVRFYQSRGLLPPPARSGRTARYSEGHLRRLNQIRDLKGKGLRLATIGRLVEGSLAPPDAALARALEAPLPGESPEAERMTIKEFAAASGFPLPFVEAMVAEGVLIPRTGRGGLFFTGEDLRAASAAVSMLEAGLPIEELLELARRHDRAARQTAERAVELFERHVRPAVRQSSASEQEAANRLVEAFQTLLPATVSLVAHHFRRALLAAAQARVPGALPEDLS